METLDYDLLKNGSFLIVVTGCGVVYTANNSFQMLYPLFLEVCDAAIENSAMNWKLGCACRKKRRENRKQ